MGELNNLKSMLCSLPPGCRFYPSEEQLICCYLIPKNNDVQHSGSDVISEIDLYNYDPFDLPETACFRFGSGGRKRHWYCYTSRVLKGRGSRRAGGGYWEKRGKVKDVVGRGAGKVVVGTRSCFVFYLGDSPKSAMKTDWIMYEYAPLINHHKASFVLCRVFVQPNGGNNISDHVLSSCGEESVAMVRHIGVQHDGTITSGIGEAIVLDDNSVDKKNEVLRFPMGLVDELDDPGTGGTLATGLQFPSIIQPNAQVISSGLSSSGAVFVDALATQQLLATLEEEDFIELDDLECPLLGIDYK